MIGQFEGYNKFEHDYIERTDDALQEQLSVLSCSREYGLGERRVQIEGEMARIAFELSERLRESRNEEIEDAWKGRECVMQRINISDGIENSA